jgi:hypothetical protein
VAKLVLPAEVMADLDQMIPAESPRAGSGLRSQPMPSSTEIGSDYVPRRFMPAGFFEPEKGIEIKRAAN